MAVRPQHMHDGGIVERRLRPIYDWLDNGNNKKALQEAEKVLKKSPTLQAARALKALSLFRLGKGTEAHTVLEALAKEKPSDDSTLQAMTICYRESQQFHKVCELYEAAVKAEPNNEELYSHLFMSYVRIGDYRSQQRAAMSLYKFAPKNPYYFWAVMSIILQAKTTDDSTKKGILLTLAQRMVDNFISENKMEAEQEARLYIMILELQEKWEDILNFIEGPLYAKLVPGSTAQACIPYLKKLGHWRRLNLLCKELLWDSQDRWDYYLPYFDSVFQLMKNNESDGENSADDTAEKCHEFICQLVETMSSGRTLRGPYLARLELWKRLSNDGDPTTLLGSGVALCIQYLRVFASKPCAVPDLKPYLAMIPQKEREDKCRDFLTCLGYDENSEPELPDDIQRHISCICAWRLTSPVGTAAEYLSVATILRRHYLRCVANRLVTATPTEFCAADGYGTLAAHYYFNAAVLEKNATPIVEALCLLELVLHHSPSNFHVKLLLVTFYHLLGNASAAESVYRRLEAKHVQALSLGWAHGARLAAALAAAAALRSAADAAALHRHTRDGGDHLAHAYKYGTFDKLPELAAFTERLSACAWCALAARERALLPLLAGPPAPLHAPPPLADVLTDNRDLNAIVTWDPPQLVDHDLKARTFEEDVAYLRLKDGLVSSIALCIECAEGKQSVRAPLRACVAALGGALAQCRARLPPAPARPPALPHPFHTRLRALVTSPVPYRELYTGVLSMTCALCEGGGAGRALEGEGEGGEGGGEVGHGGEGGDGRAHAAALRSQLGAARAALAALTAAIEPWGQRTVMEGLANFLEFIGVITFLLGVCNELITPANTKKSKKKANQSPDQILTAEMLSKLNDDVQETIAFLLDIFDKWPTPEYTFTLEDELGKLNVNDKYQCPVEQKLKNGLQEVLADVKNILKKKAKYLKTLQ